MNRKDYCQQKALLELEQTIRERCLSRVVKNDGTELAQLLEGVCYASEVTHAGDFVFTARHSRTEKLIIFTKPTNGSEDYIQIIGYNIEPKRDAGIVPILKDEDIGDADEELVEFAQTIDFRALYKQIKVAARVVCDFARPRMSVRENNIHIEFSSENIAFQTGPFSAVLEQCYIHSFSHSVFRDKETGAPKYWANVHIRYKHKDGGENGMEIGTALYCDGTWEFGGLPQTPKNGNQRNSPLPSSLF